MGTLARGIGIGTGGSMACVLAVIALAASAANAVGQTSGQSLFEQKCADCHSEARVLRRLRSIDPAERVSRLERLLPGHYAAEAGERSLIIDYLVARAAR